MSKHDQVDLMIIMESCERFLKTFKKPIISILFVANCMNHC